LEFSNEKTLNLNLKNKFPPQAGPPLADNYKIFMSDTPEFSVKPLEEEEKPKRRRAVPRRKTVKKSPLESDLAMARHLDAIYKDENGDMPDMKKIDVKKGGKFFRRVFVFLIMLGLLAAAAWAGFFMMPSAQKPVSDQVTLKITGPEDAELGATTTITITYENNQRVALNNVVLTMRYPEGFMVLASDVPAENPTFTEWQLNSLPARQTGEVIITGKMYGSPDTVMAWRAFLNYRPTNFQSDLQTMATFENKITRSPYTLKLAGPDKIGAGKEANFTATLENAGTEWLNGLTVVPIFPANFRLSSSTPTLTKTAWVITPGTSTQSEIKFSGQFSENADPLAKIKLQVIWTDAAGERHLIAENEFGAELIKNSLSASLAVNGTLTKAASFPGDMLNATIVLKNGSDSDMTKMSVKLKFDAPSYGKVSVLNWADSEEKFNGVIKGTQVSDTVRRGEIVWDGSKIPELKKLVVGKEITWDMQLPVKDTKTADWEAVKEFLATGVVEVTFTDKNNITQTLTSNQIEIIFNSDLKAEVRDEIKTGATGNDEHAISWVITNTLHPLKNVTLSADIYGDVEVKLPATPPAGKLDYDSVAKHLTWTIDEMTVNTDVLALPFTVVLKTKNPTQNVLVSKVRVQALDNVTGEQLNLMADEIGLTQ